MRTKFRVFDPSTKVMFVPDVVSGDGRNVYATGRDYENGIDCNDCPLMQFTGLLDKNGKDIYEGDVMEYGDMFMRRGVVSFDNKTAAFVIEMHYNNDVFIWKLRHKSTSKNKFPCVIGNIYENPELL